MIKKALIGTAAKRREMGWESHSFFVPMLNRKLLFLMPIAGGRLTPLLQIGVLSEREKNDTRRRRTMRGGGTRR